MNPHPAALLCGYAGYAVCTSGRAPSMNTPFPTKICATPPQRGSLPTDSPVTASRQIVTPVVSISSNSQPEIGIAPVTPVALSTGVSTAPNGLADLPFALSVSVTSSVSMVTAEPARITAMAPNRLPETGRVAEGSTGAITSILSSADPDPDDGVTRSQGLFDRTVHTALAALPPWRSWTVCADVCDTNVP